jgi:hypothetical protein
MADAIHATDVVGTQLVFPQTNDENARTPEGHKRSAVAKPIALNFCIPEFSVGSRHMTTAGATVPETSINKYCQLNGAKVEVGTPQNVFGRNLPASNSGPYQRVPQLAFSRLVAMRFYCCHVTRPLCGHAHELATRQFTTKKSFHGFRFPTAQEKINPALAIEAKPEKLLTAGKRVQH